MLCLQNAMNLHYIHTFSTKKNGQNSNKVGKGRNLPLTLALAGWGRWDSFKDFFRDARRTMHQIVLKFCIAYGISFAPPFLKNVDRVLSYHGVMTSQELQGQGEAPPFSSNLEKHGGGINPPSGRRFKLNFEVTCQVNYQKVNLYLYLYLY